MYNYTPSFYSFLHLLHLPFQPHQKQRHQRVPRSCDTHLFETQRAIIPTPLFSSRWLRVMLRDYPFKYVTIIFFISTLNYIGEETEEVKETEDMS